MKKTKNKGKELKAVILFRVQGPSEWQIEWKRIWLQMEMDPNK